MRTAGRPAKKNGRGLGGLGPGSSRRLLAALSLGSTGLKGRSLLSTARRCRPGGDTLGLRRFMPPCSTT